MVLENLLGKKDEKKNASIAEENVRSFPEKGDRVRVSLKKPVVWVRPNPSDPMMFLNQMNYLEKPYNWEYYMTYNGLEGKVILSRQFPARVDYEGVHPHPGLVYVALDNGDRQAFSGAQVEVIELASDQKPEPREEKELSPITEEQHKAYPRCIKAHGFSMMEGKQYCLNMEVNRFYCDQKACRYWDAVEAEQAEKKAAEGLSEEEIEQ